ncbi:MAG: putative aldehyde dehydrogenase [Frankiales bacterium]|nr:putative aldehyde dehydrogenase [Frankiales bacterium]
MPSLDPAPLLLDGAEVPGPGETLDVLDPRDGSLVGRVPLCGAPEVEAALTGAVKAFETWRRTSPGDRSGMLKAAARALRDRVDEIAELQSREGGKPLGDSRGGVEAGIGTLEQYAELAPLHRGKALQGGWDSFDLMTWEPRGVAVVLTPWNDPAAIVLQGLGGALAAGNTVVFKPSERTPLCGALLASVLAEHLPPGVLQVLHGDGRTGALMVEHPAVDVAYHVGSSVTGRAIAEVCARSGAHAILEGGGKDACIVDAGVDPVWAAEQVALGAFANAGQICVSIERVYVHSDVAPAFLEALVARAGSFEIGPMVDERQRTVVQEHVASAVAGGATVLAGGSAPDGPGAWFPPTVLSGCTDDMDVMSTETFGPVAAVRVVGSFDEALAAAKRSTYGLAATVLTPDMAHAQAAARELPVGTVKVNAAFGGAPGGSAHPHRGSGQGVGYGPELLDEMSQYKVVHWSAPGTSS